MFIGLSLGVFGVGANSQHTEYQSQQDYIQERLQHLPKAKVYWLNAEDKATIESILAHPYAKLRVRYWQAGQQSIWILEEIGKEMPITVGIHVNQSAIANIRVLTYRESRGDEVRHDFFTDQFNQARLSADNQLDKHIDGITGATLSVRALTKLARIALYLSEQLPADQADNEKNHLP